MLTFKSKSEFQSEVRKRVRAYFRDNQKSTLADYRYYLKAVANLALYLVPFVVFLMGYQGFVTSTLLWTITGLGMAGVGVEVRKKSRIRN
jgi:linoleoyl-CoA desaturase